MTIQTVDEAVRRIAFGLAVLLLVMSVIGCTPRKKVTYAEAEKIADGYMVELCDMWKLKTTDFTGPRSFGVKTLRGVKWRSFFYQYKYATNAKVHIAVSEFGDSDVAAIGPGVPDRSAGTDRSDKSSGKTAP